MAATASAPRQGVAHVARLATKDFVSTLHKLKADVPCLPLKLLQRRLWHEVERMGEHLGEMGQLRQCPSADGSTGL